MTPEYTAKQAREDAWVKDLRRLLALLWEAACDADPVLEKDRWRGRYP